MTTRETLESFAATFVVPNFRERLVHEALKKPRKLHERVCHRISELFLDIYKDARLNRMPDGACLLLGWSPKLQETTWTEASKQIGLGGILIIDISGYIFYAESEGAPRIESWAGAC